MPMAIERPAQASIGRSFGMSPKAMTSDAAIPRSSHNRARVVAFETPAADTSSNGDGLHKVESGRGSFLSGLAGQVLRAVQPVLMSAITAGVTAKSVQPDDPSPTSLRESSEDAGLRNIPSCSKSL